MKKFRNLHWFLIAGVVAGLTEVIWISAYSFFSDMQAATVARAVSATVFPDSAGLAVAPYLGLAIHLVLSILLAIGFGSLVWPLVRRMYAGSGTFVASIVVLALVWKINFYVLLPVWNTDFVNLLPLPVTFASKILFGVAMGLVLISRGKRENCPLG